MYLHACIHTLYDSIVAVDLQSQDPTFESLESPESPKLSRVLRSQRSHRSQRSVSRFRSSSPRRGRSTSLGSSPKRQREARHDMAPGHGIHLIASSEHPHLTMEPGKDRQGEGAEVGF